MEMNAATARKIVVHRGADKPGRYIWSPFVTKLEFRFRHSNLAYTCGSGGPANGPKGKMPFIELSMPEKPVEVLADSALIFRDFVSRQWLRDLNAGLSKKEAGQDLAIRAMLEDKLTYCNMHERWVQNFYPMRDFNLAALPYPLRVIIGYKVYRGAVQKLHDQGMSRFSNEEIHSFRVEIWEAVNGMLEDSRSKARTDECFWILGGKEPTEADATVFGFVVSTMMADAGPTSRELVKTQYPTVVDYATKIHRQYFPDYEIWN